MVLTLGAVGQVGIACESPCEQPFRPVAAEDVPNGGPFVEPWPVTGTPRPPVERHLDTDGDGVTDTAELTDGQTLVVHRSTGDLVLTVPAPVVIRNDPAYSPVTVGDLDGDGRSEVVVATGNYDSTYVVSGATPDGSHAVADVGARPWAAGSMLAARPVGDVDGDGHDDLAAVEIDTLAGTHVWSGADVVLTPGTASTAPPTWQPPGRFEWPVPLDGRDAIALQSVDGSTSDTQILLWLPEVTLRFTTEAEGVTAGGMLYVFPQVIGQGDDTWMTVTYTYRTIAQRWAWDLDDPCAGTGA